MVRGSEPLMTIQNRIACLVECETVQMLAREKVLVTVTQLHSSTDPELRAFGGVRLVNEL